VSFAIEPDSTTLVVGSSHQLIDNLAIFLCKWISLLIKPWHACFKHVLNICLRFAQIVRRFKTQDQIGWNEWESFNPVVMY